MSLPTFATFESTEPDDTIWSEGGDVKHPGGKSIAERLASSLKDTVGPVGGCDQHSFYGWHFSAGDYWCLLQQSGPWLLIVEDRTPLLRRVLASERRAFKSFLEAVNLALAKDRSISSIQWHTRAEYERQGRPIPKS